MVTLKDRLNECVERVAIRFPEGAKALSGTIDRHQVDYEHVLTKGGKVPFDSRGGDHSLYCLMVSIAKVIEDVAKEAVEQYKRRAETR